jgi:hypothetical protein
MSKRRGARFAGFSGSKTKNFGVAEAPDFDGGHSRI